jgi:hypothetical protein
MNEKPKPAGKWLTARNVGVALAVLALVVVVAGVALSVQRRQQLRQIRQQMSQADNTVALQVVEDWRASGWLTDGHLRSASLNRIDLRGADLSGADLWQASLLSADLSGADLSDANLSRAVLDRVDLEGADLTGASLHGASMIDTDLRDVQGLTELQLAQTRGLLGATLPDGTLYDGRYRLALDMELADRGGIERKDDEGMAAVFGVPLEVYQDGQVWADTDDNLTKVRTAGAGVPDTVGVSRKVEPGAIAVLAAVPFSLLSAILLANVLPAARK